ncbi:hypothetical protein [Labrys monachus]|uniref:Uncharacterized protein n=1 Tax=Labrys monachus TaxID=217067 RepID=A0ABU0FKP3_9HYPH|nr:hypothetical protein [Labrys monachus]MDQ0395184.1 hypothetical protein [Labrys monachus]
MPNITPIQGNTRVIFSAAELNTLLIDAAAAAIGQSIGTANVYVVNSDGEPLQSPQVIQSARVIAIGVTPES